MGAEILRSLRDGKALDELMDGREFLRLALCGDHPGKQRKVNIRGAYGTDIEYIQLDAGKKSVSKTSVAPKTIPPSKDKGGIDEKVNPKTLKTASPGSSRSEQAAAFLKKFQKSKTRADKLAAAVKLVEFKRHTKLGWWRLNITDTEAAQITSYIEKYGN